MSLIKFIEEFPDQTLCETYLAVATEPQTTVNTGKGRWKKAM